MRHTQFFGYLGTASRRPEQLLSAKINQQLRKQCSIAHNNQNLPDQEWLQNSKAKSSLIGTQRGNINFTVVVIYLLSMTIAQVTSVMILVCVYDFLLYISFYFN